MKYLAEPGLDPRHPKMQASMQRSRYRHVVALRKQETRLAGPRYWSRWLSHNLKWIRADGDPEWLEVGGLQAPPQASPDSIVVVFLTVVRPDGLDYIVDTLANLFNATNPYTGECELRPVPQP